MSFQIHQSGAVGFTGRRTRFQFEAKRVLSFGRGLVLGFMTGVVVGGAALGWLAGH